ncbi:MAG: sigma-70 family RNA polymerase sigma factor [Xanthomonadales bacterium]|nr:sigma-70 family RNA polymerase sigma factor [Xanthomonadales bacterium]NIX13089.1 sigma-70 family RNA polymerase sigma factor [Xanthomonadales bacterium]
MHKDSDTALLEDCKNGDRKALDSLVRRYERPVYNAAFRMLGNPDEAADVTQTVFLKAFENLDRFDPKYRFFSWIYRIAVNESINQFNRNKRAEPLADNEASSEPGPERAVESGLINEELQAALMALHEDHRAVIVLRHFTGYSYRQIGEILDIPEKTVKSRLFSARQKMRDRLERRGVFSA